jgi:predicted ribosomally synthesized peptide with nif11-like leader
VCVEAFVVVQPEERKGAKAMSIEAVEQFRDALNPDEAMQQELLKALSVGPKAIVELGRSRGFSFTPQELTQVLLDAKGLPLSDFEQKFRDRMAHSDELSDFELELVAGGGDQPSDTIDVTGSAKG